MKCIRGETARERLAKIRMYRSRVTPQKMLAPRVDRMGWHPDEPTIFLSPVLAQRQGRQGGVSGERLAPTPPPDSPLCYLDPVFNLSKLSFLICKMGVIISYIIGILFTYLISSYEDYMR